MDGETVVAVTDVYDFSELEAAANNNGASPRSNGSATLQYETSDTTATAPITLVNGSIVRGQLHSTGDYDYYLFTADRNGTIDFKLLVPETYGTYYNIRIYKKVSNYYTSVGGSVNGGTVDEYCRIANVSYGDIYRIEIYPTTSGLTTSYYYLQVENRDSKAWFPQSMGKIITSTIYYWNTNKLTRLSYYDDLTEDPIDFTDEKSGGEDGMSVACALSASAMIFSNMGAKTSNGLYDFRLTDEVADSYLPGTILQTYSDWLTPDPYIAFLVNNNLTGNEVYCTYSDNNGDGIPQAEEYSYLIIGSGYTMGVNSWQSLAEKFGKSEVQYASFAKTQSGFETALENAYLTYPLSSDYGVLVFMQTGTRTHYIVVTKENGEYIVYDPGQKTFYNKELSSYMGATYNFDDIEWFRVFY